MAGRGEALAKLSRPRLHAPLPRPRLFERLDALRGHNGVWVAAPPGAGKTTLVASYLDERQLPGIWYQIDPGDLDPASFFFHLKQAARHLAGARRAASLVLLRPEYLIDLAGFARRFFRTLFELLPESGAIVFDNAQFLAGIPAFDTLFGEAIDATPATVCLMVISRLMPGEMFAGRLANRHLALLEWDEMRFDADETRRIAAQYDFGEAEACRLYEQSDGWAAGLMLLLERGRAQSTVVVANDDRQMIFDYFAAQLFAEQAEEDQRILLQLSVLPRLTTSLADALTGGPRAARLLESLYQRHLFIYRRLGTIGELTTSKGQERIYEFHALFREFLGHRFAETAPANEVASVVSLGARLLEAHGALDEAVQLFARATEWPFIEHIVVGQAEKLIAQGRWRSVLQWSDRIPENRREASPRVLYWRGVARMAVDPARARAELEAAFELASNTSDVRCRMESAAAIVETHFFEYSHFTPLDRWIPVLRDFLEGDPHFDTHEAALRMWLAFLDALMVRPIAQDMLQSTLDKVFELAVAVQDANLKASAARTLILCCTHTVRLSMARQVALFAEPLLEHPDVLPVTRAMTYFAMSWMSVQAREYARGMRCVACMEKLAADQGMPQLARLGHYMGGLLELFHGNLEAAHVRAERMEKTMFPNQPYDVASHLALKAWIAVAERDAARVLRLIPEAIRLFDQVGSSLQRQGQRNPLHWAYVELGDVDNANRAIEEAMAIAAEVGYERQALVMTGVSRAMLAKRQGEDDRMREVLRELLAASREFRHECWLQWFPSWMPELCAEALAADIESDYVRYLIRSNAWPPPRPDVNHWPWRLRVRALGPFTIEIEGAALAFDRKAPRKVLALLEALIALGGHNVPIQRVLDALWPDEEADAASSALNAALRRLRTLLGDPDVIVQSGKELSIDRRRCWVDVWAFEQGVASAMTLPMLRSSLEMYSGNFLAGNTDAAWAIPLRERLRDKFVHLVEVLGCQLERGQEVDAALQCYRRGLEIDDLVEIFYQGQMRCYLAMGRAGEAIGVYRRLRHLFSIVLGIEPSAATRHLLEQARMQ